MIVFFSHDSALFDPENPDYDYLSDDRDTEVITLHKMLNSSTDFWNPSNFSSTLLGRFDPPPHIIAIPFDELPAAQVRVLPLPQGTPVSFGHNAALLQDVQDWFESPGSHYGIMLKAGDEPLDLPNGDQEINFLREAVLRLTFQRYQN